jgi:hypothetical protein
MATGEGTGGGGQGEEGGQEGQGTQGSENARRAEESVERARTEPGKEEHIFDNPEHQWGRTGLDRNGNWDLIRQTLESNGQNIRAAGDSPFEVSRTFGDDVVTVRGRVVNGVIRLGTSFVNAAP